MRLGFLASHRGSNVEAILKEIEQGKLDARAKVIISNNPKAPVLNLGKEVNIPCYCLNKEITENPDEAILNVLRRHDVNLVVLAGYVKKIGIAVLDAYPNRMLNIHPSLLPKYGGKGMYGMRVHEAVIQSRDRESGATVHIVTQEYDEGRILAQYKVPRYERDTVQTLAERVLGIEHVLYPQTLKDIQRGILSLD
ncbi:phosphoribosylglycinamide formyltransferase [Candidatus Woesearchaeota archaeon]|nr:MAG: phosphoribosylglycinamide formyltransferase [Candidatus Woesearchaeota archaeon]